MDYLYENFLNNHHTYNLNVGYWTRIINKFSNDMVGEKYLNTKFNNGRAFLDGNPIYNIYFVEVNKAVKIIQEAPESLGDYYKSYKLYNGHEYLDTPPELCIILTLTRSNVLKAKKDIEDWFRD